MDSPPEKSVWTQWRWPLVAIIVFVGTLLVANRVLTRLTQPIGPSYTSTTLIQSSVSRLRQEAKLVVLSADVTVEVTKTSSKILFDRLDFGDTVVTVRTRGNRAQYFVPLDEIRDNDFHVSAGGRSVTVSIPAPRVDDTIVEVQTDPSQMEIKTDIGWGRLNKRSGELARAEAKRSLRDAVINEAKTPVYVEIARKNAQEKVAALLNPAIKQMGVTNLTVTFRKP